MNMWLAIVAIVAIVICADTWQKLAKARAKRGLSEDEAGEFQSRIDALEERVRVLERIVTEDRHDLKQEINRL